MTPEQLAIEVAENNSALLKALQSLVAQVERGYFDYIGPDDPSSALHEARIAIENALQVNS